MELNQFDFVPKVFCRWIFVDVTYALFVVYNYFNIIVDVYFRTNTSFIPPKITLIKFSTAFSFNFYLVLLYTAIQWETKPNCRLSLSFDSYIVNSISMFLISISFILSSTRCHCCHVRIGFCFSLFVVVASRILWHIKVLHNDGNRKTWKERVQTSDVATWNCCWR